MEDQSQKRDGGKPDPLMIEEDLHASLAGVLAVLEYGKKKYGSRGGWKAVNPERYKSAAERHRMARMANSIGSLDDESGLNHILHELCCLMFLVQNYYDTLSRNEKENFLKFKEPPSV